MAVVFRGQRSSWGGSEAMGADFDPTLTPQLLGPEVLSGGQHARKVLGNDPAAPPHPHPRCVWEPAHHLPRAPEVTIITATTAGHTCRALTADLGVTGLVSSAAMWKLRPREVSQQGGPGPERSPGAAGLTPTVDSLTTWRVNYGSTCLGHRCPGNWVIRCSGCFCGGGFGKINI